MREKIENKLTAILLAAAVLSSLLIMACPDSRADAETPMETAITWAINTAKDDSHGYSQTNRWGPDYDCSSFIISALKAGGIDTGQATDTSTMKANLMAHGFSWTPWSTQVKNSLKRGDILLKENQHADLFLGNKQIVAAHGDRGNSATGDQTGTEVSVSAWYTSDYDGVLRYTDTVVQVTDCNCSTSYAGTYVVTTASDPLNMRSGHGTGYELLTKIPRLSIIYVTKANGTWAHVSWNGYNGFCTMEFLTKVQEGVHIWDDGKVTKSPSASDTGVRTYTCVVCGETKDESIPMLALDKPKAPSLSNGSKGIQLKWKAVAGASSYILYRKVEKGSWTELSTVSGLSYTDVAVKNGTCYRYRLQAASGTNTSARSASGKLIYLTAPKLKKLTKKSTTSLKVSYGKNKKADGYQIEYSRYASFENSLVKKVNSPKTTAKLLTGLRKKEKYYVRVRAYKKVDKKTFTSCWSNVKKKKA